MVRYENLYMGKYRVTLPTVNEDLKYQSEVCTECLFANHMCRAHQRDRLVNLGVGLFLFICIALGTFIVLRGFRIL